MLYNKSHVSKYFYFMIKLIVMINDLTIFEQFIDISNFKIILDKINFKSYYNIKNYFFFK